jgi:hypothetical protein
VPVKGAPSSPRDFGAASCASVAELLPTEKLAEQVVDLRLLGELPVG